MTRISDFHYLTADLIEKCFTAGKVAAQQDKNKPEGEETQCPYTDEYERRWWLRGYESEERRITLLHVMNRPVARGNWL